MEKEKSKVYKDPSQTFGRPRKHTDLEKYAIFRQWEEKGDIPPEAIALEHKISVATLKKYIEKYRKRE